MHGVGGGGGEAVIALQNMQAVLYFIRSETDREPMELL